MRWGAVKFSLFFSLSLLSFSLPPPPLSPSLSLTAFSLSLTSFSPSLPSLYPSFPSLYPPLSLHLSPSLPSLSLSISPFCSPLLPSFIYHLIVYIVSFYFRVNSDFLVSCKGVHNPHPSSVSRELSVHNWEVCFAPHPANIHW